MPLTSQLRFIYLAYISKPVINHPVYRVVRQRRIRKILEVGVGLGQRAVRMIEVAAMHTPVSDVHYTGVDLFEARAAQNGPAMTLKTAHRLLKATGARVRLLPGDPFAALARAANTLAGTELVVISADQDPDSLARAWFYLPRMLRPDSQVLIEERCGPGGELAIRPMACDEIDQLAAAACVRRAA